MAPTFLWAKAGNSSECPPPTWLQKRENTTRLTVTDSLKVLVTTGKVSGRLVHLPHVQGHVPAERMQGRRIVSVMITRLVAPRGDETTTTADRTAADRATTDDAAADARSFRAAVRDVTPLAQPPLSKGLAAPKPRPRRPETAPHAAQSPSLFVNVGRLEEQQAHQLSH